MLPKLSRIVAQPKYIMVTLVVTLMVIVIATWLPNIQLVYRTISSSTMTMWQKTRLVTSLLGSWQTNFTPLSKLFTVVSGGLAGIQTSLLMYYMSQTARLHRSTGMTFLGVIISLLGIGCAACGSVILTSMLGFSLTMFVLSWLPLRGAEFGVIGISILLVTIMFIMKKINDPQVCRVKPAAKS